MTPPTPIAVTPPTPIAVTPQTQTWTKYVSSVKCNCSFADPAVAQAACPIHAYHTGHLPWTACNIISAVPATRALGCNCNPLTPAQAAAYSGTPIPIPTPPPDVVVTP